MTENRLDYDEIIWKVALTGITPSVIILYYYLSDRITENLSLYALTFGFALLGYSTMLILGYGHKKKCLEEELKKTSLSKRINNKDYVRVPLLGEIILIGLVVGYFITFGWINFWVPATISILFLGISIWANLKRHKK